MRETSDRDLLEGMPPTSFGVEYLLMGAYQINVQEVRRHVRHSL
jgi:hypothetical protein